MKIVRLLGPIAIFFALQALPATAQTPTDTLEKIKQTGEISIGYRESSVPFSYLDENRKPVGYTIDICNRIVANIEKKLGKKIAVKYVPVNGQTRIPLTVNGTIDAECGSTTNNLTRQQQVEYLPTIFITGTKILTRKDSGITSIADLDGKSIGVPQSSTNERTIKAEVASRNLDTKVLTVKDHAQGFLALETGRIDAYSTDHVLLYGLISKAKSPDDYVVVGDFLSFDPYSILIRRNDANFELIGKETLAELFRSGEINTIYDKWFGPIGVDQTDLLVAAFKTQALPE